jgi:glycosyltransferase involved in cell wall biosynthesis
MELPRVTVVTPSYNQGHFLRSTIESVLAQDYPNLEYIIIDGGSTDGTSRIAAEYSSRLRFISEPDRGQTHAINKGFRMAAGQIVAWLNSDDLYLPGAVRTAVRAIAANPEAGFVYGEGYLIDEKGEITQRFPHTQEFDLWRLVYLSDYILQQTCFFRKSALDAIGPLEESLRYGMDWDILIRLAQRFPVAYVRQYLGCLREYPTAKSFAGGAERARELHRILARHTRSLLPPGAIIYGLDTYSQIWQRWADRTGRPKLVTAMKIARGLAGRYIERIVTHRQGLYADGWAGPRLRLMLHAGEGEAVLRGSVPWWARQLEDQELRVYAGKRLLVTDRVAGNFRMTIPAGVREGTGPLAIQVEARRWIRPKQDGRRLAYLFGWFGWDISG